MTIPKHEDLWQPVIDILSDGQARHSKDLEEPLAQRFDLSDLEIAQRYDSGNGPIFYDRITWALSFLSMAGLLERPKRGVYRITPAGHDWRDHPQLVDFVRGKQVERRQQREEEALINSSPDSLAGKKEISDLTPQEQLYESFQGIRRSVYDDLIDTILSKTPKEFEKLVVQLLERMGYGGEVKNAGEVSQYTNDGGIDGVIKEDVLGLGRVHIQAKRYARQNTVGREEVQKFVGALAVAQSKKGVFITTSKYSPGAIDYANSLHGSTTVVLIDGDQLAHYLYDYSVGLQTEQIIKIKKLDSDFWDQMQDAD